MKVPWWCFFLLTLLVHNHEHIRQHNFNKKGRVEERKRVRYTLLKKTTYRNGCWLVHHNNVVIHVHNPDVVCTHRDFVPVQCTLSFAPPLPNTIACRKI
jgi:hypothetical protein